jgi:hypothetical protein
LCRWLIAGLALVLPSVWGQSWQGPHAVLFFRATEVQGLAWTQRWHSASCESNLRRIGLAARLYAADHNGRFPADWQSFRNDLVHDNPKGPQLLYCPADTVHPPAVDWGSVDLGAISYKIVSPDLREENWQGVFARCSVHGNLVSGDGVVQAARPYDRRPIPMSRVDAPVLNLMSLRTAVDANWSLQCLNQLKQIGLAARLYANDNNDRLPPSFEAVTNELGRASVLVCPGDLLRPRPTEFADLDWGSVSYVLDAPGRRLFPGEVGVQVAHCRTHGHVLDSEGAVTSGTNRYPPRLIVGHPLSQTVTPGQPARLVVLTGDPALAPFRYQWRRLELFDTAGLAITNIQALAGATNRTYELTSATANDEGYYDVVVEDALGGCQLSHLAYVRVESIAEPLAIDGWEAFACTVNLRSLYLASRLAQSSRPTEPDNLLLSTVSELTPFLGWPLALYCPADAQRVAPDSWAAAETVDTSYLISRGVTTDNTNRVFATCKVHGHQVLSDGRQVRPGLDAIRPEIVGLTLLPEGRISLTVRGIAGLEALVEASFDLRAWTPSAQGWLEDGQLRLIDAGGEKAGARFYRARYR